MLDAIIKLLEREPFQPFRIVLTSGKEYDVTNPHLVAVGKTEFTVYAPKSDNWAMLRMNQIASVETSQAA